MSKKLLRYCSFDMLNNSEFKILLSTLYFLLSTFYFSACAPKVAPPPLYRDVTLSLEEIKTISRRDIHSLKAIVSVNIEKDNSPYLYLDASVLLKEPGWLQMKWYKLGMLTGSLMIKDNTVYEQTGKGADKLRELGNELFHSVFWWEGIENARMVRQDGEYVIRSENREIRLDALTLLPKAQEIIYNGRKISIIYDRPMKESDYWYKSEVKIETGIYRFSIKINKLIVNPPATFLLNPSQAPLPQFQ